MRIWRQLILLSHLETRFSARNAFASVCFVDGAIEQLASKATREPSGKMSHNFVKQADGSKVCSWCGDERNVDRERECPRTQLVQLAQSAGKLHSTAFSYEIILSYIYCVYTLFPLFLTLR